MKTTNGDRAGRSGWGRSTSGGRGGFSAGEAIAEKFASDAETAGGGGDIAVGFAESVGDEGVDHAIEGEAGFGEAPGGVAPGGGRCG